MYNGIEVYNLPLAFAAALTINVIVSFLVPRQSPPLEGAGHPRAVGQWPP